MSSGPARIHQDPVSENKIMLHPETQFCRGTEQGEGKVNVLPLSKVTLCIFICSEQLRKRSYTDDRKFEAY